MKIRDSLTGRYISDEEAEQLTPERYVVEQDTAGTEGNLEEIYTEIRERSKWDAIKTWASEEFVTVDLKVVKEILEKHGMKV